MFAFRISPRVAVIDGGDPCLKALLEAPKAGLGGGVHSAAENGLAKPRGGQDGVLLGMNTNAEIVSRPLGVLIDMSATITTTFGAIGRANRRAVVTSADDSVVTNHHCTDFTTAAIGPASGGLGEHHEVFWL